MVIKKKEKEKEKRKEQITDNKIWDEGAYAMSEMLQKNTTLTSLKLRCEEKERERERKERKEE